MKEIEEMILEKQQIEREIVLRLINFQNKYNVVDVDSIYDSKRHKKTGKILTDSNVRAWVQKYITKYVTKNMGVFKHLAWHCSLSVSALFTSIVYEAEEFKKISLALPTNQDLYKCFKTDFVTCYMFKFVPPEHLFKDLQDVNELIFSFYDSDN